jgi:hypothetical protein
MMLHVALAIPAWSSPPLLHVPPRPCLQLRAHSFVQMSDASSSEDTRETFVPSAAGEAFVPAAANGELIPDSDKTDGIPNYLLRFSGTVTRVAESPSSSTTVQDDGVLYEPDRLVSILTSDVIDMVQQQGGAAEKVDYLGENILVDGLLFDDLKPESIYELSPPDSEDDAESVTLEIVEHRPSSELELGQLADDDAKRQSIASLLSISSGFSGWTAKVGVGGRVRAGFKFTKRSSEGDAEAA